MSKLMIGTLFVGFFLIVGSIYLVKFNYIQKSATNGKKLYEVDEMRKHGETYFTNDISYPEQGIIEFQDEFGYKHRMSSLNVDIKELN